MKWVNSFENILCITSDFLIIMLSKNFMARSRVVFTNMQVLHAKDKFWKEPMKAFLIKLRECMLQFTEKDPFQI